MEKIIAFCKKNPLIVIVYASIILLRFIWMDHFPTGMQYDEVEYSLSSKTFQLMGTDLSGTKFPESLLTTNTLGRVSPIPYMILSPLWYFLDLNMVTFRTVYVVLNLVTAFVFVKLLQTLFKNDHIATLGGILFLINPWSFFLSRHAMDGSFALLFYLLGILFLLQKFSKQNMLLSFLFFFLGFFSYHGAKVQLVPIIMSISLYKIFTVPKKERVIKPYLFLTAIFIVILGFFLIGGKFVSGSILETRTTDIVFLNPDGFADDVNTLRKESIESPIHNVIINKWYFVVRYFIENYFYAFSPISLFLSAEVITHSGFFYVFEFFFLIIGFIALFLQKRKLFWLITALTIIAPLSTAISTSGISLTNRAILLLPSLLVFITFGVYTTYKLATKYFAQNLTTFTLGLMYAGSFMAFLYLYFYILPIQVNAHYQTSTRTLSHYLSLERNKSSQVIVIASKPQVLYSGIVFYLPKDKQEEALRTKQTFSQKLTFNVDNITITDKCPTGINAEYTYIVDPEKVYCFKEFAPTQLIVNQKDAGTDYFITGGKSCQDVKLSRWVHPHKTSDFDMEDMTTEQFCQRWIATNLPNEQ